MSVNVSQLRRLQTNLNRLQATGIKEATEEATKELAGRMLRGCVKKTPVISGHLKGSWKASSLYPIGNGYTATIYNPVEYAPYVETGHRTRGGGWKTGRFMLKRTEIEIEKIAPKIVQKVIDKKLRDTFV